MFVQDSDKIGGHVFAPCPIEHTVITYEEMKNILTDFRDSEFLIHGSPVVVTATMAHTYSEMSKEAGRQTYVFKGASGVRKTTALLFIGHMARRSGCLVFPIRGHEMRGPSFPWLVASVLLFRWMEGNRDLLRSLNHQGGTLLNFLEKSIDSPRESVGILVDFISAVKKVSQVPVIFLIDQGNALWQSDSEAIVDAEWDTVCRMFCDFNSFTVARGSVFYAYSASFCLMPRAKDGLSESVLVLSQMDMESSRILVAELVRCKFLPGECNSTWFERLYELCGGLPRELESFSRSFRELCREKISWDDIEKKYFIGRAEFYRYRIRGLLSKEIAEELRNGSVEFACRYFVNERMHKVPEIWQECGMIVSDRQFCRLPCPAAEHAFLASLQWDDLKLGINIFREVPSVRWKALELAVVWAARFSVRMSLPMILECTDLCGRNRTALHLVIKNIQRHEVRPAIGGIPSSTMFICPDRQPLIEFFIHDESGKHYFLQVSESPYIEHSSKLADDSSTRILQLYKACAQGQHEAEFKYIYLTTSTQLMKWKKDGQPVSDKFDERVWLVSNANGCASEFLHGLL